MLEMLLLSYKLVVVWLLLVPVLFAWSGAGTWIGFVFVNSSTLVDEGVVLFNSFNSICMMPLVLYFIDFTSAAIDLLTVLDFVYVFYNDSTRVLFMFIVEVTKIDFIMFLISSLSSVLYSLVWFEMSVMEDLICNLTSIFYWWNKMVTVMLINSKAQVLDVALSCVVMVMGLALSNYQFSSSKKSLNIFSVTVQERWVRLLVLAIKLTALSVVLLLILLAVHFIFTKIFIVSCLFLNYLYKLGMIGVTLFQMMFVVLEVWAWLIMMMFYMEHAVWMASNPLSDSKFYFFIFSYFFLLLLFLLIHLLVL